jgi:hypothetical protein
LILVPRETRRANALLGEETPVPRPTRAAFVIVAACCTGAWLSTSLLVAGHRWQSWLAAYLGLLILGAGVLVVRWYFRSIVPMFLLAAVFVVFSYGI